MALALDDSQTMYGQPSAARFPMPVATNAAAAGGDAGLDLSAILGGGGISAPAIQFPTQPQTPMPQYGNGPMPGGIGQAAAQQLGSSGVLGNGNVNPLQQMLMRQMGRMSPGGAGTPVQQAQGQNGQLGGPAGTAQGGIGAMLGGYTVPQTTEQSPFFNATNATNAQQALLKSQSNPQTVASNPDQTAALRAAVTGIQAKGKTGADINSAIMQALQASGKFSPQQLQAAQLNSKIGGTGIWGDGAVPVDEWIQQLSSAIDGTGTDLSSIMLGQAA